MAAKKAAHRFGGRATSTGVGYEGHVAARLAVRMLIGEKALVWPGVHGGNLRAVTLQAATAVDDVVVELAGLDGLRHAHLSAKDRAGSIPLTAASPAFADTMKAFVRQFIASGRKARLGWVVPTSAGTKVTRHLLLALENFRRDAGDQPLHQFIQGRSKDEADALRAALKLVRPAWKKLKGGKPTEAQLKAFLRAVCVEVRDFGHGKADEEAAEAEVRAHLAADPADSGKIWQKIDGLFADANRRVLRITADSLRRDLKAEGLRLQAPPDYAADLALLDEITARSVARLSEHAHLPFGPATQDQVAIARPVELGALQTAVQQGHTLVTGEPGGGKSGLVHAFAAALRTGGTPVVLLLAEEVFNPTVPNLDQLKHSLDATLAHWPDGAKGVVTTDALDAVRDAGTQKRVRELLHSVQQGQSGWTVVASVREFDLRHGRELREGFPGAGAPGYAVPDFSGVAHFHVPRFTEAQVDQLVAHRPEIGPFVQSARANSKSADLHRSPFYLRLAATLLKDGVPSARLADWNSPALLLRRFWHDRINEGEGAAARQRVLKAICQAMVDQRSMSLSEKELNFSEAEQQAVRELRSRGILQGPRLQFATLVNTDQLSFAHHLLHDYAIARALVPETGDAFVAYVVQHPLLPIFYRQSFIFALEELWDADEAHSAFWVATLRLEGEPKLHGITRLLGPILAARRVRASADLAALLTAVRSAPALDAPGPKALTHLTSGLQDCDASLIRDGADAWCEFVAEIAPLLPASPFLEPSVVHLLARLRKAGCGTTPSQRLALNSAARALLTHHATKPVHQGWAYAGMVAIEAVCLTFAAAPAESEAALLTLLAPERLKEFPHEDFGELAEHLGDLPAAGAEVVRRVYRAAFAADPERGKWRQMGTRILPMTVQTSDDWNLVHYRLAAHYEQSDGADAAVLTEAACSAWGAVYRRRNEKPGRKNPPAAVVMFRGQACELRADYSHIAQRAFENEENRILTRWEALLRQWAAEPDPARLHAALDRFATCNPPALLWSLLMEAGAEHPTTLGRLLVDLLDEPVLLTHFDYLYAAAHLLGALHQSGDPALRARLETIVLELPARTPLRKDEKRLPVPEWLQAAQDRALSKLQEANLARPEMLTLWRARKAGNALEQHGRPDGFRVTSRTISDREHIERAGVDLKRPANADMFKLREDLKALMPRDNKPLDVNTLIAKWSLLLEAEKVIQRHRTAEPKMAADLWGHLVAVGEAIARNAEWPKRSPRWKWVRRLLLRAARDPKPGRVQDDLADDNPHWGWPAPRVEAAEGLPMLSYRLGGADAQIASALRRLTTDYSKAVRFNLAHRLAVLEKFAPGLMWELIDRFIVDEQRYSVLECVVHSLDRLWPRHPAEVLPRLAKIAAKAGQAPADHDVHDGVVGSHFFEFLRTGRKESGAYIDRLLGRIIQPAAGNALSAQVATCRSHKWFVAGDPAKPTARLEGIRARTWSVVTRILAASQTALAAERARFEKLFKAKNGKGKAVAAAQERIKHLTLIVDNVNMQLFFSSGAHDEKNKGGANFLTPEQAQLFWREARPLLIQLADELHPHTAYHLVQTLHHLLPYDPREVFLLAMRSIRSASVAGMQHEHLAVGVTVKLIQQALADHRDIFRSPPGQANECLNALLEVFDLFVEAGWTEARQLTNRLEEIYR
ncbi:MAG TPA: hypothetical protein VGM73_17005 [Candidatus Didemnitutus sp.]|jgi:hypothetical protein